MLSVSIIIINYNTFKLTCQCINSIIDKTKDISYEIILVDNASTECNADGFKKLYPNIELIKSSINLGFSKGNNLGISNANGNHILLLNSDTILVNNAVKIVSDFLTGNTNVAAASSKLIFPDGRKQYCCQKFPSVWLLLFEFFRLQKVMSKSRAGKLLYGSYFDHETYAEPDWIWGTFFMFPKKNLDKMKNGKLNDDFFMYIEDMQWCLDIRRIGLIVAYLPNAIVTHHMGASSGEKKLLMRKNYNLFLKKNFNFINYYLLKK